MKSLVGFQDGLGLPILEWLHKNVVAVEVVQYHHVVVASAGWDNKASSLVRMNLASDVLNRDDGVFVGRLRQGMVRHLETRWAGTRFAWCFSWRAWVVSW